MLQHGYNGSEVAPYQYEASVLSAIIALRGVTGLAQHVESVRRGFGYEGWTFSLALWDSGIRSLWRVQIDEQGLGPTCGCEFDSSESHQASVVLRKYHEYPLDE
jgi:hypothetical protein